MNDPRIGFLVTLVVSVIAIVLFIRSVNGEVGNSGEVLLRGSVKGGLWFVVLTVSSFFCLEAFSRLLAVWTGYR